MPPILQLTPEQQKKRVDVYQKFQEMQDLKNQPFPHFSGSDTGERSFLQNIDASEAILNGLTLTREQQGKEEWQSNLLDNVSRAKLRAVCAGVGLKVPRLIFNAVGNNGVRSSVRADIFKHIVQQSFKEGNPTLQNFLEVWTMLSHGVVFEYEGFKTGGAKIKMVDSFDSLTGEVKYKEEYVKFDGCPVNIILNPQEFFWWDMFKAGIQDQPRLIWAPHYTKRQLEIEFSKYPNFKYVKDRVGVKETNSQETTYYQKWSSRCDMKEDYEVIKYFSLEEDSYQVWVNGIPLVDAPMLWGGKKKYYPFAKTISEPYANPNFFVGMPFGQLVEAYQDGKNTVLNTLIDKLYRSMEPRRLVGIVNKDLYNVQSELQSHDNTVYVPDVSQVSTEKIDNVNQAELAMLQVLDRGIESVSISSAGQGVPKADVTATADKIAYQRSEEIRSNLYIMLEDLWLQKTRLRVNTILTHYLKDKAVREEKRDKIISVYDYTFGDGTRGILDIYVAKNKGDRLTEQEIQAREMQAKEQGLNYKLISVDQDYLDEHRYDFEVVSESLHGQDVQKENAELMDEVNFLLMVDPAFLAGNKEKYLSEKLSFRGKRLEDFNPPVEPQPMGVQPAPQGTAPTPLQEGASMLQV